MRPFLTRKVDFRLWRETQSALRFWLPCSRTIQSLALTIYALFFFLAPALAQDEFRPDLTVATDHFRHGRYDECLKHASLAVEDGIWNERWYLLKIRTDLVLGNYASAKDTLEKGMQRYTSSIQLRWIGQ